jgi:undecaprenyl-diphosphatase
MSFIHRYRDTSRPHASAALRDFAVRAVLPALVVFAVLVGLGQLLMGPLGGLEREDSINADIQQGRSGTWDAITKGWSMIGNTEYIIAVCVLVSLLLFWRTRHWWLAVVPGIAIAVQSSVFVAATHITGRERPDVPHLDPAPPTSSFPSGHVGASFALYVTFLLLAQRLQNRALRIAVSLVCVVVPFLVSYARLYRGMHHLSDVVIGAVNGIVCAVIAWGYLRRSAEQ